MRRRLAFLLAALVAVPVLLVVTLPFWLGAAARAAGPARGLVFRSYERIGYARFALHDVEFQKAGVRVTASRLEVDTPVLWAWRHWRNAPAPVAVGNWRVEVQPVPGASPRPPNPDRGWVVLRGLLQRIAGQLDRWLPRATVGAGVVHWPTGEIGLGTAKWEKKELAVEALTYRALQADATVSFAESGVLRVSARAPDRSFSLSLESRGAEVSGRFTLWAQPATLTATFAPRGWLPTQAALQAADWSIPGERLKLGQLYSLVRGTANVGWREQRIVADVTAASEPLAGKSAPPLNVVARAHGDGSVFTVESLRVALPGVNAQLTAPVTIDRGGKIHESAARFAFEVDLAKQPWFAARGMAKGEARLLSGLAAAPVVELTLDARNVAAQDVNLSAVTAAGRLEWPRLQIASGTVAAGEGERLVWHGGWDFTKKELLDAAVEGQIRRASIARWLPKQPGFDEVKINARAAGPLAEVNHSGRAEAAGVTFSGVKPLAVAAEWHGRGAALEQFEATAAAGATQLVVGGSVDATALKLARLELARDRTALLRLAEPAVLTWRPRLQLEALHLAGPQGEIQAALAFGEAGRVQCSVRGFSSKWLEEIAPLPGPAWQVSSLALMGTWDRGPMTFSLTLGASLEIAEARNAAVNLSARGDKSGLRVEALRATEGDVTVVNASGRLPLTLSPAGSPVLHIDPNGALAVDASVEPSSGFWQKLSAVTGVELQEPAASAHLTGTWQRPQGNAFLQATKIAIDSKRVARPLPAISQLDIKIAGEPNGISLETFSVEIEGQVVRARGRLPVPEGQWTELFKQPLVAARRGADLRVEVPEADIAVFARFLPAVLAPKGRLQADFTYKSGGVEGFLKLREAATRPLGPLGVLQEISADIALSGRKLALRGVTARSGGQPITLTGTIELPETAAAGAPAANASTGTPAPLAPQLRYDLALRGENLPFVRQTGLLVRGDLDLKLQTPGATASAANPPRLSGTVRLRDSLFLSDLRSFLPKGNAGPARRPPYFSVDTPPANTWQLAVDVTGEQFMRLRTPVFTGLASARFRLGGTLGEPRAIGEVAVDEGRIRMPFASFDVKQGSVRLTEADPYEPTIYLRGTGRRYNYDLAMEIDGKVSGPNVTFTSSPALDSEQVLLMVMTGVAPKTDAFARSTTDRFAGVGYFLGQSLIGNLLGTADQPERLTVQSGERVSEHGKETYQIEYKLSDRWTLTGERTVYEEFNAGVKWRVFGGKREGEGDGGAKK